MSKIAMEYIPSVLILSATALAVWGDTISVALSITRWRVNQPFSLSLPHSLPQILRVTLTDFKGIVGPHWKRRWMGNCKKLTPPAVGQVSIENLRWVPVGLGIYHELSIHWRGLWKGLHIYLLPQLWYSHLNYIDSSTMSHLPKFHWTFNGHICGSFMADWPTA